MLNNGLVRMKAEPVDLNDWPNEVEIEERSDAGSGYGTLARQVERAFKACGVATIPKPMRTVASSMVHVPDRPKTLVPTQVGLRWVFVDALPSDVPADWLEWTPKASELAFSGNKSRKWSGDRQYDIAGLHDRLPRPGGRDATRLAIGLPEFADYDDADRSALMTMWETSEVPKLFRAWRPHLRRPDVVMVPAKNSRDVIRNDSPEVKVRIVPLATEADRWPYFERSTRWRRNPDRTFVFLCMGDLSMRKGPIELYEAFHMAFGDRKDVALVYKSRAGSEFTTLIRKSKYTTTVDRPERHFRPPSEVSTYALNGAGNVRILRGTWPREKLVELLHKVDCFVWPSMGEGWAYPPREAAATGLPVIAAAHTGQADAGDWAYTVGYHRGGQQAIFRHWGGECGTLNPVNVADLAARMAWIADHKQEAFEFGRHAAEVVTRRTLVDMGRDMLDVLSTL